MVTPTAAKNLKSLAAVIFHSFVWKYNRHCPIIDQPDEAVTQRAKIQARTQVLKCDDNLDVSSIPLRDKNFRGEDELLYGMPNREEFSGYFWELELKAKIDDKVEIFLENMYLQCQFRVDLNRVGDVKKSVAEMIYISQVMSKDPAHLEYSRKLMKRAEFLAEQYHLKS